MNKVVLWVALAIVVGAGACVPLPVLAPPMKVTMGAAVATGDFSDDPAVDDTGGHGVFGFSAGVHPLQYIEGLDDFDAGLGVVFEAIPESGLGVDPMIGSYVEAGYRLWQHGDAKKDGAGRLFALGRAELLNGIGPGSGRGIGLAIGLGVDLINWQDGEIGVIEIQASEEGARASSFFGYVFGQGGVGAELTLNFRQIGDVQYDAVFLKLTFRVPTTAGVYLLPVF